MSQAQADWILDVLGFAVGTAGPPSGQSDKVDPDAIDQVRFAKQRWLDARAAVKADLDRLRAAALAELADDPLAGNLARLDEVLAGLAAGLEARLDEAGKATDPARRRSLLADARTIAQRTFDHVLNDGLIDHIETNPFSPVIISGRLLSPLSDIQQALAEAAGP